MNPSVRFQASSEAAANSSCFRSKKLCGAPSYDDLMLHAACAQSSFERVRGLYRFYKELALRFVLDLGWVPIEADGSEP
jgi:hypothetical protein